jgi:predicted acyltransferase
MTLTATAATGGAPTRSAALPGTRLISLDVFRGITIAGMLLVNNPGSWAHVYPPLLHAEWHGWTPTDLIFPLFLFIVGVSMTLSFGRRMERGADRGDLFLHAARRAAILVALGLVLNGFPSYDLSSIRLPGVLQRIGVAYLIASGIVLFTGLRAQVAIAGALLLGYWAAMGWVPVPGYGSGAIDDPTGNLAAYLDRAILGTQHLWAQAGTWDPEGLLSTLPAVATVLTGVFAGRWIGATRGAPSRMLGGVAAAGVVGVVAGLAWDVVFPINKPLWTSSYVVFTSGAALLFLAACYWVVDLRGWRRWAWPFVVFGMNAIAAFFLSSLAARLIVLIRLPVGEEGAGIPLKTFLHETLFASWAAPRDASLLFALSYVAVWVGLIWLLHRKGIFLKV